MNPSVILQGFDLWHGFGQGALRTQVLRGTDIRLNQGEILLIVGPSGSGKSTLLAILAGLLRPDSGQVRALGTDLWSLSTPERKDFRLSHFGFIFQGFNLFATLTVQQQLEMVLCWGAGMSPEDARSAIGAMLEQLDLRGKGSLRPQHLSGGEKQRVAIARGLICKPGVCFADEPTSALDWDHGKVVMELFRHTALLQGTAVLIVSHDVRLIPYADRLLILEAGRLGQAPEYSPGPQKVRSP